MTLARRSSVGGLIVGLLALTSLGVAGALIPLRKCVSCGGFVLQTPPRPVQPLDCPDCADRGKVSLFRSWMKPRVSEPVAGILRSLAEEEVPVAFEKLSQLVRNDGKDPDAFLSGSAILIQLRFVVAEGATYLILILQVFTKEVDATGLAAVLLTAEGRAADRILVTAKGRNAPLHGEFVQPYDDARITISCSEDVKSYRVDPWERPGRELLLSGKPEDSIVRLAIRRDRFEIQTPEVRR